MLDDRLHGKDLEWARDHLRRCESCRERVEDFREMMMRVGRLPSAQIGAVAMDEAFARAIPDRVRAASGGGRGFDAFPLPIDTAAEPILDLPPQPVRPEVTNVRDLMSDLEREIFRDEPAQDHPTAMPPVAAAAPTIVPAEPEASTEPELSTEPVEAPAPTPAPIAQALPGILAGDLHAVSVDSRQAPVASPPEDHFDNPTPPPPPPMLGAPSLFEDELAPMEREMTAPAAPELAAPEPWPAAPAAQTEAKTADSAPATGGSGTGMRVAVGLGAAACVLLAAFLYEGGLLSRGAHKTGAVVPRPTATVRALTTATPAPVASASPSASTAPVLLRLGDSVTGGTVYRIRPGTAVAGYTRLVFDIRGHGLPAMVITQPDATHVAITFSGTAGAAVPVKGIRSFQVAAVEPGVEQGPDLVITVDLARPVRVTAFTLPAAGAYSNRLVVDLHTS